MYCKQFVVATKKTFALDYDAQKRFVVTMKEFYDAWKQFVFATKIVSAWNMMLGSNCCGNQENFCFGIWCSEEIAVATKKTSALEYGVQKKLLLQPRNFCFGIWCSEEIAVTTKKTSALEYGIQKKLLLQTSKLLVQENLCSGI